MIELLFLLSYLLLFLAARADCLSPAAVLKTSDLDLKSPFGMDISWLYFGSHFRRGRMTSLGCLFVILYCYCFLGGSRLLFRTPPAGVADTTQGIFVN